MTARFLALYETPTDPEAFDRHYREVHILLGRQLPGLRRYAVGRDVAAVRGVPYYLVAELEWHTMAELRTAFASPEGRATALDAARLQEFTPVRSMIFTVDDSVMYARASASSQGWAWRHWWCTCCPDSWRRRRTGRCGVWVVPMLVWLATAAWRRRSVACGLAALVGAVLFSGLLSIPWPGHPPRPELLLASDQYALYGLAVLAGIAMALARERSAAGPEVAILDHTLL